MKSAVGVASTLLLLTISLAACGSDDQAGRPEAALSEDTSQPTKQHLSQGEVSIAVQVRQKQCFTGYGCNVTYQVKPTVMTFDTPPNLDSDYDVTYVVRGPKEGPETNTLQLGADGKYAPPDEVITVTPAQGAKLTAKVVSVEPTT